MTNLLAILVSLAMMLTGATAPVAEPVSRTLLLSNLTVAHNDETVTLTPYASLGVTTDGETAALDFYVGGESSMLPFQVVADAEGLLIRSDNSDQTLRIGYDQLQSLAGTADFSVDNPAALEQIGEFISAYIDVLKIVDNPEEMQAIQAECMRVYGETVDRGTGRPDTVEYDDQEYAATIYEYTLDAAQMGALTDAIYASNEKLSRYAKAYFAVMQGALAEAGAADADNFEKLLAGLNVPMTASITETIADEANLNITDMTLRMEMEQPVEVHIYSTSSGDVRTSEISCEMTTEEMSMDLYGEAAIQGRNMAMTFSVTAGKDINVWENAEDEMESVEDADAKDGEFGGEIMSLSDVLEDSAQLPDDDDSMIVESDEEEPEGDDAPLDADGSAGEISLTMDFSRIYDESLKSTSQSLNWLLESEQPEFDMETTVESTIPGDGTSTHKVNAAVQINGERFGLNFEAGVLASPIEIRARAADAVSLDQLDSGALLNSVTNDVAKLSADPSVQAMVKMIQPAVEQVAREEIPDVDPDADESAPEGDAGNSIAWSNPEFGWLPDGFALESTDVDAEYSDVSCMINNQITGDSIFVDITPSYSDIERRTYLVNADGEGQLLEGTLITEEIYDGSSMFSMDDGTVSINVFPSADNISSEDIVRILCNLKY